MGHQGKIEQLNVYPAKGKPVQTFEQIEIKEKFGPVDDYHSGNGLVQVTFLTKEACDLANSNGDSDIGLCYKRFKENICISGIPTSELTTGRILLSGSVRMKILEYRKKCFPDCAIAKQHRKCPLTTDVRFLEVLRGGTLTVNDKIHIDH